MRYFVVVLATFALLQIPALRRWEWLDSLSNQASLSLAIGIFLSGIHHAVFANHYVELLPADWPAKARQVYLSAALRMLFGIAILFAPTRIAATIATMVLLSMVLPVNVRVAVQGNVTGQLVAAGWFLWLRLLVHISWIGWCGWCLSLKSG